MGMFGGSAQSSQGNQQNLDFSPIFNIGDSNSNETRKTADQAQTISPKVDDSFSAAASVGVGVAGGSGSGGPATLSQQKTYDDIQPAEVIDKAQSSIFAESNNLLIYALLGVGLLGGFYFIKKAK